MKPPSSALAWIFVCITITFTARGVAQESGPATRPAPSLPRAVTDLQARVKPLVVEEQRELYDSSKPGRLEMQIVFSHPVRRAVGGGGGLADEVGGRGSDDPRAEWRAEQEQALRQAALQYYRELTGDEQGQPQIWVRSNDLAAGMDYAQNLLAKGYKQRERRDGADGLWAALYAKHSPPAGATLGKVTRRITVSFEPTTSKHGTVRLGASAAAEVLPADPPAGVDAAAWKREHARLQRLTAQQGQWLAARVNRLVVRAPDDATEAFAAGRSVRTSRSAPLWGEERPIEIELRGKAGPVIDKPLGASVKLDANNWREHLAGYWDLTVEHQHFGLMYGRVYFPRPQEKPASDQVHGYATLAATGDPSYPPAELRFVDGRLCSEWKPVLVPRGWDSPYWEGGDESLALTPSEDLQTLTQVVYRKVQDFGGPPQVTDHVAYNVRLARPAPAEVDHVFVRPLDESAKSYKDAQVAWKLGETPHVLVLLSGRNLPVADRGDLWVGPLGISVSDPAVTISTGERRFGWTGYGKPGERMFDFEPLWPKPTIHSPAPRGFTSYAVITQGTRQGGKISLVLRLGKGMQPGPKRLTFADGTSVEIDFFAPNDAPPPEPSVLALGIHVGSSRDEDSYKSDAPNLIVTAILDEPPRARDLYANVWIEREGKVVYRVPPALTRLSRRPDSIHRDAVRYFAKFSTDSPAPAGDEAAPEPFTLRPGDVVKAELEGRTAEITPLVFVDTRPRPKPRIAFFADEACTKSLGEAHTVAGQWAQMFPVGQDFWITARYYEPQTDKEKTIRFSWLDNQLEFKLMLFRPAINLYRGGPFFVKPPPEKPADAPADAPPPDEEDR